MVGDGRSTAGLSSQTSVEGRACRHAGSLLHQSFGQYQSNRMALGRRPAGEERIFFQQLGPESVSAVPATGYPQGTRYEKRTRQFTYFPLRCHAVAIAGLTSRRLGTIGDVELGNCRSAEPTAAAWVSRRDTTSSSSEQGAVNSGRSSSVGAGAPLRRECDHETVRPGRV